jgi:hypothetical protein
MNTLLWIILLCGHVGPQRVQIVNAYSLSVEAPKPVILSGIIPIKATATVRHELRPLCFFWRVEVWRHDGAGAELAESYNLDQHTFVVPPKQKHSASLSDFISLAPGRYMVVVALREQGAIRNAKSKSFPVFVPGG